MDYSASYQYSYGWGNPSQQQQTTKDQQQYAVYATQMGGGQAMGQQQQQQHDVNKMGHLGSVGNNQNRSLGGYWSSPSQGTQNAGKPQNQPYSFSGFPGPSPFAKSSFPKKGTNWSEKKRMMAKKPYNPNGKTPAMLLHELFKNVLERFDDLTPAKPTAVKMYRCVVTVDGRDFQAEAANKKLAKQKASEVAVQALRPDISITPWEEVKPQVVKQEPPKKKQKMAAEETNVMTKPTQKDVNKISPIESALSLLDLLRKLCADQTIDVQMEHTNITEGDQSKVSPNKHRFRFTLSFPAQDKQYVKEGFGKTSPKDLAIREALKEIFGVSDFDIQRVVKRSLSSKLTQMNPIQVLHHMAAMMNKEVVFEVHEEEKADVKKMPVGATGYYATCIVKEQQNPENQASVKGDVATSKVEAKMMAAKLANVEIFGLDLDNIPERPVIPIPACQKLQILLMKKNRGRLPKISYEDLPAQPDSTNTSPVFRIKCKIHDKEEYFGVGKSKKMAKNDAAHQALKAIFKFDYDESLNNDPSPHYGISKLCYDISEYTKREYFQIFFLLNEKDEKRLLSIGSCPLTILSTDKLESSEGLALIHMQSIVLARRSMIRYFLMELEKLGTERSEESIFQTNSEGVTSLRSGLRVVLYSTFAPDIRFSTPDAQQPSLSIYTAENSIDRVPDDQQTLEDALNSQFLRVHSVADKIFKWCHLGVQGALLSTLIQPIKLSSVYFGSIPNSEDSALRHSFYNRIGAAVSNDVIVESNKIPIQPAASVPHVWTRDIEHLETLNPQTGRTARGAPSRLAKAELFQTYLRKHPENASLTYNEVKAQANNYQQMKQMFYKQIADLGYGQWQQKPAKIGDFKSSAEEI
ncbi:unnamed protein product, partial [Mesorhabditis belari]|uniref:Uncharacterized protein n=1 Tax=Mesorhabditis belari TaxID=2138241 RepID=A0AAF3ED65_9BILA